METRTHLQMGQVLMTYKKNFDLAKKHLQQAWKLPENLNGFDDVKSDTASLLTQLYQQQSQSPLANQVLQKALVFSQNNKDCVCKLLLQLSQIHAIVKEYSVASELLGVGKVHGRAAMVLQSQRCTG